jgi:hypothetical protein
MVMPSWGWWAPRMVLPSAAAALIAASSADARANCAMPATYYVTVAGSSVTICPSNLERRGCPDSSGLLRVSAVETVEVAERCLADAGQAGCYVDECVPPGDYQYGFARPYECCEYCCGTYYYATATVVESLSPQCASPDAGRPSDAGDAAGPESSASAPWSTANKICDYAGPGIGGRGGSGGASAGGSGGMTGGEAGATSGTGGSEATSTDGCSCTMTREVGTAEIVLGANGLLVLLGLLLGRRRRAA